MNKKKKNLNILFIFILFLLTIFLTTNVIAQTSGVSKEKGDDYVEDPHPHSLLSAGGAQGESLRVCVSMGCCSICDIMTVISKAFKILRNDIAFPAAIIFGIIGGIMIIFSAGSPNKIKSGKNYITAALIGLMIIFGASLIVNTVLIAISKSKWTYEAIMNGQVKEMASCTKSCTPGVDPEIKTITGWVPDKNDLKRTNDILREVSQTFKEVQIITTATTNGEHKVGSCHYVGRAADLVTGNAYNKNQKGEAAQRERKDIWPKIVNYLNNLNNTDWVKSGERIQAFCETPSGYKDPTCTQSDHIHFEIEPCG